MNVRIISCVVSIDRSAIPHVDIRGRCTASGITTSGLFCIVVRNQYIDQIQTSILGIITNAVGIDTAAAVSTAMRRVVGDTSFGDGRHAVGLNKDTAAALPALISVDRPAFHHKPCALAHAADISTNGNTASCRAYCIIAAGRFIVQDLTAGQIHDRTATDVYTTTICLYMIGSVVFDHTARHGKFRTTAADLDAAAIHTGISGYLAAIHGHSTAGVDTAGSVRITKGSALIVTDHRTFMDLQVRLGIDDRSICRKAGFASAIQYHVLQAQTAVVLDHDPLESGITVQHDRVLRVGALPGLTRRSHGVLDISFLYTVDVIPEFSTFAVDPQRLIRLVDDQFDDFVLFRNAVSLRIDRIPRLFQLGEGLIRLVIGAICGICVRTLYAIQVEGPVHFVGIIMNRNALCRSCLINCIGDVAKVFPVAVEVNILQVLAGRLDPLLIELIRLIRIGLFDIKRIRGIILKNIVVLIDVIARKDICAKRTDPAADIIDDIAFRYERCARTGHERVCRHAFHAVDSQVLEGLCIHKSTIRHGMCALTGKYDGLKACSTIKAKAVHRGPIGMDSKRLQPRNCFESIAREPKLFLQQIIFSIAEGRALETTAALKHALGQVIAAIVLFQRILDTIIGEVDALDRFVGIDGILGLSICCYCIQCIGRNARHLERVGVVGIPCDIQFCNRVFSSIIDTRDRGCPRVRVGYLVPELIIVVFIAQGR